MQDKDHLEEFIKENRSSFETHEVPEGIWAKIEKDLDHSIDKPVQTLWYWKAAVVVLMAAVAFLIVDKYTPASEQEQQLSELSEFEELETFYTSIISKKETKLQEALRGEEAINYLESDIEELELLYNDLRKVYTEEQSSPGVSERLIHLLRQRIHLINSQLDIIAEEKVPEEFDLKLN